jgi:hypothetical protein
VETDDAGALAVMGADDADGAEWGRKLEPDDVPVVETDDADDAERPPPHEDLQLRRNLVGVIDSLNRRVKSLKKRRRGSKGKQRRGSRKPATIIKRRERREMRMSRWASAHSA